MLSEIKALSRDVIVNMQANRLKGLQQDYGSGFKTQYSELDTQYVANSLAVSASVCADMLQHLCTTACVLQACQSSDQILFLQ